MVRWQSGPMQRFAKPSNRRFESGPHLMIIGLDYGLKKIGVACSEGLVARPFGVISNTRSRIQQLKDTVKEPVDYIVIGIPNSYLNPQITLFSKELSNEFNCKVFFQDETNSSNQAIHNMIQSGIPPKKRRKDDAFAATVILQDYLDKNTAIA